MDAYVLLSFAVFSGTTEVFALVPRSQDWHDKLVCAAHSNCSKWKQLLLLVELAEPDDGLAELECDHFSQR
jgi:hypothetical protein